MTIFRETSNQMALNEDVYDNSPYDVGISIWDNLYALERRVKEWPPSEMWTLFCSALIRYIRCAESDLSTKEREFIKAVGAGEKTLIQQYTSAFPEIKKDLNTCCAGLIAVHKKRSPIFKRIERDLGFID